MALDKNIFSVPNNERSIDSFKTRLAQGGARPNLFEVEMDFPSGVGILDEEIKEDAEEANSHPRILGGCRCFGASRIVCPFLILNSDESLPWKSCKHSAM